MEACSATIMVVGAQVTHVSVIFMAFVSVVDFVFSATQFGVGPSVDTGEVAGAIPNGRENSKSQIYFATPWN